MSKQVKLGIEKKQKTYDLLITSIIYQSTYFFLKLQDFFPHSSANISIYIYKNM